MKSYDYAHRSGIIELTWEEAADLMRRLAEEIARQPIGVDVVVGIARAGLFPATAVACALRREFFPIRLSRRQGDRVIHDSPVWRVPVPPDVAGQTIAVIDEISDSGETLRLAAAAARQQGAHRVITAALVAHTWATPPPDCVALTSDALIVFPWDREVLIGGQWVPHPELVEARAAQGEA